MTEVFLHNRSRRPRLIRDYEWLEHPGSIGWSFATELRSLDEAGRDLPPGEIGKIRGIFMRPQTPVAETYRYLGTPPATTTPDGFVSVGDLGWVDAAGYLFIADRRTDLSITGGANVYPAEVEAALSEQPAVADVVVTGVPVRSGASACTRLFGRASQCWRRDFFDHDSAALGDDDLA